MAKKRGRPSTFKQNIADKICLRLAEGESLRTICTYLKVKKSTVLTWVLDGNKPEALPELKEFADQYTRARELQIEGYMDESLDIADDGSNDWYEKEGKNGRTFRALDHEHVQRSRLRIDTRKWYASKLMPKKYGDKIQQEISGPEGAPVKFLLSEALTPEQFEAQFLSQLNKKEGV